MITGNISNTLSRAMSFVFAFVTALALSACNNSGGLEGGRSSPSIIWTWVDGSTTINQFGTYGTEDVADAVNVPGARTYVMRWTDTSGKLWLFGGLGRNSVGAIGYLNDLWQFDPATGQWTWIDGSNNVNQFGTYGTKDIGAASNVPGARLYGMSWTDISGKLWLFGGFGYDSTGAIGSLNDLWQFDPATGQWTWVNGSTTVNQSGTYGTEDVADAGNVPGARYEAVSWTDASGKFWLFGGSGRDSAGTPGSLNDLWKFDPATGQWAWVDGSSTAYQTGTYGTKNVADASNVPGARQYAVSWTDASGKLWLFGGAGNDATGAWGDLSDLWQFDPATGHWTWVGGSTSVFQLGTYGSRGIAADGNAPGGRVLAASWIDASGKLWLFGGLGYDGAGTQGRLNDLWKFDPVTGQWTWVDGSTTVSQSGTYGTEDVAAARNVPGARESAVTWADASGKLWLFGGTGLDSAGALGHLNDLWTFQP